MIASMLRRLKVLLRTHRWVPVNPRYRLVIRDVDTPEVEARIDALKAMFGLMDEGEIRSWMNTTSPSRAAVAAHRWGRS